MRVKIPVFGESSQISLLTVYHLVSLKSTIPLWQGGKTTLSQRHSHSSAKSTFDGMSKIKDERASGLVLHVLMLLILDYRASFCGCLI